MRVGAIVVAALLSAGCAQDMRSRGPTFFADNLKDIHAWDPETGAENHPAYDIMFASEQRDAVPVLILKLKDKTPTAIQNSIYDPPTVGHVAFHILLKLFSMKADQFAGEGVWTMTSHPSKNPIYMIKFGREKTGEEDRTREMVATRFRELATQKGWY